MQTALVLRFDATDATTADALGKAIILETPPDDREQVCKIVQEALDQAATIRSTRVKSSPDRDRL